MRNDVLKQIRKLNKNDTIFLLSISEIINLKYSQKRQQFIYLLLWDIFRHDCFSALYDKYKLCNE